MERPRLSDRLRGKSGRDLMNEIKKEIENDKKTWFNSDGPSLRLFRNRREGFPFDEDIFSAKNVPEAKSHFEELSKKHPQFVGDLHCPPWSGSLDKDWERAYTVPISVEKGETPVEPEGASSSRSRCGSFTNRSPADPLESSSPQNLRHTVDIAEQIQKNNIQNLDTEPKRSSSAPPDPPFESNVEPKRFTTKIEITPVNPFESNMSSAESGCAPRICHGDRTTPRQAPADQRPCNQSPSEATQSTEDSRPTSGHAASFASVADKSHAGECQSLPTNRSNQSQVRRIPIFIEGRSEPVVPKQEELPSEQKLFAADQTPLKRKLDENCANGVAASDTSAHFNRNDESSRERKIPVETPVTSATVSQSASQPTSSQVPSASVPVRLNSQQCVEQVQQDVDALTRCVEQYSGTSRNDKQYLYLDEMLTRNLIKLDTIEVEGNEQLRTARKNVIKCIQKSIALLESKVPVPVNEIESMDESSEQIGESQPTNNVVSVNSDSKKAAKAGENDEKNV